jgi:hypothetical protein
MAAKLGSGYRDRRQSTELTSMTPWYYAPGVTNPLS